MAGMSVYIKLCLGSLKVWYVRVSLFIRIYVRVCYGMIRVIKVSEHIKICLE